MMQAQCPSIAVTVGAPEEIAQTMMGESRVTNLTYVINGTAVSKHIIVLVACTKHHIVVFIC